MSDRIDCLCILRRPTSGRALSFATMTAVAALMVLPRGVAAGPAGGTVVDGAATISQAGSVTNVTQSTNRAVINWQGFSVAPKETVNFVQPGASSATLNRVIGNETSVISGAINANGQVFIVNSAGVLFSKGSQVNVGGLVASTLDISNSNFMAGNHVFSGTSSASVVNQGRIKTAPGGYVALLGKTVSNEGVISARLGTVAMSSGEKITLNFDGNSLVDVTIDKGTLDALVANKRAIRADGGRVILTAKAADQLLSAQVNNSGIVQARSIASLTGGGTRTVKKGSIKLLADGGTTTVSGKLDASAPKGGDGGFIETSGTRVKIADNTVITTAATSGAAGSWLIDPTDFNIVAGSDALTTSGIGATTLANNLALTSVTIATIAGGTENGDINVNAALAWNANTTLTLNAHNNININAPITIGGAGGKLELNYGGTNGSTAATPAAGTDYNIRTKASYAGTVGGPDGFVIARPDSSGGVYGSITFTNTGNTSGLSINGQGYTLIHSMAGLANPGTATGRFALARDLDAGGTTYTAAVVNTLSGTLTGLGHTISNLTINVPGYSTAAVPIGLVGQAAAGSTIRDIGLVNASVTSKGLVGSLLGRGANATTIKNAYATGTVTATGFTGTTVIPGQGATAGGLIGNLQGGSVTSSFAHVTVTGFGGTGGLIGLSGNLNQVGTVTVTNSHATGRVTSSGGNNVGGLIGQAEETVIRQTYAAGDVTSAGHMLGGLVGYLYHGSNLSYSYASGNVTGGTASQSVGGLVGQNNGNAISWVYAVGTVSGRLAVGGLIGQNDKNSLTNAPSSISNAFATGDVNGVETAGGFVGQNVAESTITDAWATGNVTGRGVTGGFVGANFAHISNVRATGTVNGDRLAGGIAGINHETGTLTNAVFSGSSVSGDFSVGGLIGENLGTVFSSHVEGGGTVTGNSDVGGLIGLNRGDVQQVSVDMKVSGGASVGALVGRFISGNINRAFWNTGTVGTTLQGVGERVPNGLGTIGDMKGLTPEQFRDIKFYLDGTIGQVLAAREAEAAAERLRKEEEERRREAEQRANEAAASQAGAVIGTTGTTRSATAGADSSASTAGRQAATNPATKAVDDILSGIEEKAAAEEKRVQERARQGAAGANRSGSQRGGGPNSGTTIRSIEVEGQRFDLQENGTTPPASGGESR